MGSTCTCYGNKFAYLHFLWTILKKITFFLTNSRFTDNFDNFPIFEIYGLFGHFSTILIFFYFFECFEFSFTIFDNFTVLNFNHFWHALQFWWQLKYRDLWPLRHWLQLWQFRTWIHENLCQMTNIISGCVIDPELMCNNCSHV